MTVIPNHLKGIDHLGESIINPDHKYQNGWLIVRVRVSLLEGGR